VGQGRSLTPMRRAELHQRRSRARLVALLRGGFDPAQLAKPVIEDLARPGVGRADAVQRGVSSGNERDVSYARDVAHPLHLACAGRANVMTRSKGPSIAITSRFKRTTPLTLVLVVVAPTKEFSQGRLIPGGRVVETQ
jgi:hypothetical protein